MLFILSLDLIYSYRDKVVTNNNVSLYIDNSLSMKENCKNINKQCIDYIYEIDSLLNSKKINTDIYIYGDKVKSVDNISNIDFKDSKTDFSLLYEHIMQTKNESIIITDGVINSGNDSIPSDIANTINIFGIGNIKSNYENDLSIDSVMFTRNMDSLQLTVKINSTLDRDINKINIGLLNQNNQLVNFSNVDFFKGVNLNHEISASINNSSLTDLNFICIDTVINEQNLANNKYEFKYPFTDFKILIISGSVSLNTKAILDMNSTKSIEHYYRISDKVWNKDFANIYYDHFDLVILDNYPYLESDIKEVENISNISNNIIYFLGPIINENKMTLNKYLKKYDYVVSIDDNYTDNSLSKRMLDANIMNLLVKLPQNRNYINVVKNKKNIMPLISYENGNILLDEFENKMFVFLPNIIEYNYRSNFVAKQDLLFKILDYYIERKYKNTNEITYLYASKKKYDINELITARLETNHEILNGTLGIYDKDNYLYTSHKLKNNGELLFFEFSIPDEGKYKMSAELINKDSVKFFTNNLELYINKDLIEASCIYQDSIYLKKINYNTFGQYLQIEEVKDFFESYSKELKYKENKNIVKIFDYINIYWLIFVLLLITEWVIRKYKGLV